MKFLGNMFNRNKIQVAKEEKTWVREIENSPKPFVEQTSTSETFDFPIKRLNDGGKPLVREVDPNEDFAKRIFANRPKIAPMRPAHEPQSMAGHLGIQPVRSQFELPVFPSDKGLPRGPETGFGAPPPMATPLQEFNSQTPNIATPSPDLANFPVSNFGNSAVFPNLGTNNSGFGNSGGLGFSNVMSSGFGAQLSTRNIEPRVSQEEGTISRYEELQNQIRQKNIQDAQIKLSKPAPVTSFNIFNASAKPVNVSVQPRPIFNPTVGIPAFGDDPMAGVAPTIAAKKRSNFAKFVNFDQQGTENTQVIRTVQKIDPYKNLDVEQLQDILQQKRVEVRALEDKWNNMLQDRTNVKAMEYKLSELQKSINELPNHEMLNRDIKWIREEQQSLDNEIAKLTRTVNNLVQNPQKAEKMKRIANYKNKIQEFKARLGDQELMAEQIRAKSDQGMRERQEFEASEIGFDDNLIKAMEGMIRDRTRR